jgi:hypothetical protein
VMLLQYTNFTKARFGLSSTATLRDLSRFQAL